MGVLLIVNPKKEGYTVKNMGRSVNFIQCMPQKPIKHGIKVFCVCCSYTAYLIGFKSEVIIALFICEGADCAIT